MILLPIIIRLARGRSPSAIREKGGGAAIARLAVASGSFAPGTISISSRDGTPIAIRGGRPSPIGDRHLATALAAVIAATGDIGQVDVAIPARAGPAERDARAIESIARSLGELGEDEAEAFATLAIRRRTPARDRIAA